LPFINATQFSYSKPLIVKICGQEFRITSVGVNSFNALTGVVGRTESTTPTGVTYKGYTVYVPYGETGVSAYIVIKDATGSVVADGILGVGETGEFNVGSMVLKVKLLSVNAYTIAGVTVAELVVGEEVDKSYTTNEPFPGNDLWKFDITTETNYLKTIKLKYAPNETMYQLIPLGGKIVAPNDYFEFGLQDLIVKTFTTVTFSPDTATSL
jgi:hypothetical protein